MAGFIKCFYLVFFVFLFLPQYLLAQNNSAEKDSLLEVIYVYDTVVHEKIIYEYEYETVYVTDTILSVDTIITENIDTIEQELVNETPRLNPKIKQSFLDFYGGSSLSFKSYFTQKTEYKNIVNELNSSVTPFNAFQFGANYIYENTNYQFAIGSGVSYFKDQAVFLARNNTFETSYYNYTGGWINDTVESYYQFDGADTSWIYITQPNWIEKLDSGLITEENTDTLRQEYNGMLKYYYFNLPVSFSYLVPINNNWSASFKLALVPSFLLYSKGQTLSLSDINSYSSEVSYKVKFLLSYSLSILFSYQTNKNLQYYIEPFIVKGVKMDGGQNHTIMQTRNYTGINLGIKYLLTQNKK